MEKFTKLIDDFTKEYIKENGQVTCEFSMAEPNNEHIKYLTEATKTLKEINQKWEWIVYLCQTCISYDKTRPYHIEIRDLEYDISSQ
jgi:hypothetical protein